MSIRRRDILLLTLCCTSLIVLLLSQFWRPVHYQIYRIGLGLPTVVGEYVVELADGWYPLMSTENGIVGYLVGFAKRSQFPALHVYSVDGREFGLVYIPTKETLPKVLPQQIYRLANGEAIFATTHEPPGNSKLRSFLIPERRMVILAASENDFAAIQGLRKRHTPTEK